MYYYGARYYDPKMSLFISVDPLAEKYLNMTPYNYVANNPINAIDPDGRDFKMIIQRDKRGNITTITLQATVYLQGKGASQEMANKMNKAFSDKFSNSKNVNGVKVGFDVNYVYDNSKNSSNLKAYENVFNVRTDLPENKRSNVAGEKRGNLFYTGNTGTINGKSKDVTNTTIHETLHFLGLSDRYDDYEGNNMNMGPTTIPHKGFENDIMGGGDGFNNVHYENIIDFAKGFQGPVDKDGKVEYNSNRIYDRRGTTLRNGSKEKSHYNERSNQAK